MRILVCLVLMFFWAPQIQSQPLPGSPRYTPVVAAVQKAAPAVVSITCSQIRGRTISPLELFFNNFGPEFNGRIRTQPRVTPSRLGSGVIVDGKSGLVLTNAHVIEDSDEITVHLLDGREFKAVVRGAEPDFDIAVLALQNARNLPQIPLGDSTDLVPGETVIAIGNPLSFSHTVTTGVVSAKGRTIATPNGTLTDLIQTDAAINPGNSGGALIDLEGRLIGINTAVQKHAEGIGFAIPFAKAKRVLDNLMGDEHIAAFWLGLLAEDLDGQTAWALGLERNRGILVTAVFRDTPADKAGIVPGDILETINEYPLQDSRDFINVLRNQTGEPLTIALRHQNTRETKTITPVPFGDATAKRLMEERWGIRVEKAGRGLAITGVRRSSPADFLRVGDRITAVSGRPVQTMDDMLKAFRRERMANQIFLQVVRGGRAYYARLQL